MGLWEDPFEGEAKQLQTLQVGFNERQLCSVSEEQRSVSCAPSAERRVSAEHAWKSRTEKAKAPPARVAVKKQGRLGLRFGQFCSSRRHHWPTWCWSQRSELQSKIIEFIIGGTRLMMLLIPNKDVRKVYHSFKYLACERIPASRRLCTETPSIPCASADPSAPCYTRSTRSTRSFVGPCGNSEDAVFTDFRTWQDRFWTEDHSHLLAMQMLSGHGLMISGIDVCLTFEGALWLGTSDFGQGILSVLLHGCGVGEGIHAAVEDQLVSTSSTEAPLP